MTQSQSSILGQFFYFLELWVVFLKSKNLKEVRTHLSTQDVEIAQV